MCTLIETLLQHPRIMQLSQAPLAAPAPSATAGEGDRVPGNASGTPPGTPELGGAREELAAAVHDVAAAQRAAELTEWLGCAKIALQARNLALVCLLPTGHHTATQCRRSIDQAAVTRRQEEMRSSQHRWVKFVLGCAHRARRRVWVGRGSRRGARTRAQPSQMHGWGFCRPRLRRRARCRSRPAPRPAAAAQLPSRTPASALPLSATLPLCRSSWRSCSSTGRSADVSVSSCHLLMY